MLLTEFVKLIFIFGICAFHILIVLVIGHLVAIELKLVMQFFSSRSWKIEIKLGFWLIQFIVWDLQSIQPYRCWWRNVPGNTIHITLSPTLFGRLKRSSTKIILELNYVVSEWCRRVQWQDDFHFRWLKKMLLIFWS